MTLGPWTSRTDGFGGSWARHPLDGSAAQAGGASTDAWRSEDSPRVVAVLVVAGIGWGTEGMIFAFFGLWGLVGVVYGLMLVLAVIAQIIEAWRRG